MRHGCCWLLQDGGGICQWHPMHYHSHVLPFSGPATPLGMQLCPLHLALCQLLPGCLVQQPDAAAAGQAWLGAAPQLLLLLQLLLAALQRPHQLLRLQADIGWPQGERHNWQRELQWKAVSAHRSA